MREMRWAHERVGTAPLDEREDDQQQRTGQRRRDDLRRVPATVRPLDEREDEQGHAERRADRARGVEAPRGVARGVGGDQPQGERDRDRDQRHVDEEHRLPPERLREHAAEQHPDHQAGRTRAAPDRQGAVALAALREGHVDQRERGREHERPAEPLQRASAELDLGHRRQPTGERRDPVEREPGDEHPPAPEQVGRPAAEQQEAGGRHRVGADHGLQRLGRVAEIAPDLGQRDDDDVLVERDDQHRERQQRERRALAGAAVWLGWCVGDAHAWPHFDSIRHIT